MLADSAQTQKNNNTMIDLFLFGFAVSFLLLGLRHPIVAFSAYMWADLLQPQALALGFAVTQPFSMIMAVGCVLSIIINSSAVSRATSPALVFLLVTFIAWFHLTTGWATHPYEAAFKLDWATKSLGAMVLAFFLVNTRKSFEVFMFTFVCCVAYYAVSIGIKTAVGGSSYGSNLIHGGSNNGLAESSTLGGVAAACLPIILYLSRHSSLFKTSRTLRTIAVLSCGVFVIGIVGTHSRTGLVALACLGIVAIVFAKKRLPLILLAGLVTAGVFAIGGQEWKTRMSTISNAEEDSSALGRIVVWKWTLDYVKSHPFGGGFVAYLDNEGQLLAYAPESVVATTGENTVFIKQSAVAYHSVYFEVLGEQGYPGIFIYMTIIAMTLRYLIKTRRMANLLKDREELVWVLPATNTIMLGLGCLLITGMFVGVAYRPYIFIFVVSAAFLHRTAGREFFSTPPSERR